MVDVDIFTIEQRVVGNLFFTEDQNASGAQVVKKSVDELLPTQGADELKGVVEEKGSGIDVIQIGDVPGNKGDLILFGEHLSLQAGLVEHGR